MTIFKMYFSRTLIACNICFPNYIPKSKHFWKAEYKKIKLIKKRMLFILHLKLKNLVTFNYFVIFIIYD